MDERLGEGRVRVTPPATASLERLLEEMGEMPLPPYITHALHDPNRYQTVYAAHAGSAAAPTAGLHFTDALWAALRERQQVVTVTLGVGSRYLPAGRRGRARRPPDPHRAVLGLARGRRRDRPSAPPDGRRIVAVGTTAVRVLETVFGRRSRPAAPLDGRTRIFITPGDEFRAVGAMVTNFHLPRSTLLALVMAFAGVDETRAAVPCGDRPSATASTPSATPR